MSMMYEVKVTAIGEVRDADGNLIEQIPVEMTKSFTEDELRAQGVTDEQIREIKEAAERESS